MKQTMKRLSVLSFLLVCCMLLTTVAGAAETPEGWKTHVVKDLDMAITLPEDVIAYYDESLDEMMNGDKISVNMGDTTLVSMEYQFLASNGPIAGAGIADRFFLCLVEEMDLGALDDGSLADLSKEDLEEALGEMADEMGQQSNVSSEVLVTEHASFMAAYESQSENGMTFHVASYVTIHGEKALYFQIITGGYGSAKEQRELADEIMSSVIFNYSTYSPTGFPDMRGHWAEPQVAEAVKLGLFSGTSEKTFSPNMGMSRAMLVQTLYRMEEEPEVQVTDKFSDVNPKAWYAEAVAWASENEIVLGSDGRFAPEANVTREQLASILYRYQAYLREDTDISEEASLDGFKDCKQVSGWASDAMNWAVENGLINGLDGKRLAPKETTSRAQAAAILVRFLEMNG